MSRLPTLLLLLAATLAALASTPVAADDHRSLWHQGRYAEARDQLAAWLADRPLVDSADEHVDLSRLQQLTGQLGDAVATQEAVARQLPMPSHLVRLVELYDETGQPYLAEQLLEVTTRLARRMADSGLSPVEWLAVGRIYELQGAEAREVMDHIERVATAAADDPRPPLAIGDLARRKRTWDIAARSYRQALDLEPGNQQALAGLARSYHASSDRRVEGVLDTLLSANPVHPDGRLLRARQALDVGDTRSADGHTDAVLAVNPVQPEALALARAARVLDDDEAAVDSLRFRALRARPHDGGIDRIPGQIASRHYRFQRGVELQRAALDLDPEDLEARFHLGLDLLRLGRDDEARGHLRAVFDADPYHVQAYNLLEVADVMDGFERVESHRFRLELPPLEARVLAPSMLELLDEAADLYQPLYDMALATPVVVQMFANHDEFMVRSVGLPGSAGHLGICFGRLITMDSPRARPGTPVSWRQVLWHEFVHVVTLTKTRNRLPRWLSEGISVFEETRRDSSWGQALDADYAAVIEDRGWPGVDTLERLFTEPRSQAELMFGYFAAGQFVADYVERHGHDALVAALDAIGAGTRTADALAQAAGESLPRLDAGFRRHLRSRCEPLAVLVAPDGQDSDFTAALRGGDTAVSLGDTAAAVAAWRRALELFPESAAPLYRLAEHTGDRDTVARLVARDPTAWEASLRLARWQADAGDATFLQSLERAFSSAPLQPAVLRAGTELTAAAGDLAAAETWLRRRLAVEGGGGDLQLRLSDLLRRRGQLDAARTEVLSWLETHPHDWQAQQLLLQLAEASSSP